jgi:hypothetical protein
LDPLIRTEWGRGTNQEELSLRAEGLWLCHTTPFTTLGQFYHFLFLSVHIFRRVNAKRKLVKSGLYLRKQKRKPDLKHKEGMVTHISNVVHIPQSMSFTDCSSTTEKE